MLYIKNINIDQKDVNTNMLYTGLSDHIIGLVALYLWYPQKVCNNAGGRSHLFPPILA